MIECDVPTLAAQRLALGTAVVDSLKLLFPSRRIELLQTSSADRLLTDFASATRRHNRFNTVLVIGHSSHHGLQLADGAFEEWSVVAKWLAPFEPRSLVLFACLGARFEGAKALFKGIRSLSVLYGSPVELHFGQVAPLIVATVALMNGWKIPEDLKVAVQLVSFATTGGIPFRWTRQQVMRRDNVEGCLWNAVADSLNALVR